MIKFRCKTYSRFLPIIIYRGKKVMQRVDRAGLKAGNKLKGYITHKLPTVKDNIIMGKSKTQMAREALNAETRIKAAMYEPEKTAANYIGNKIIKPIAQAPGTAAVFVGCPIPGAASSGLLSKVSGVEARFHDGAQRRVAKVLGLPNLPNKLKEYRQGFVRKATSGLEGLLGFAKNYITYL